MTEIRAKIAEVVSPSQLAFNAGEDQGVEDGDFVTLYRNVTVKDPDDGRNLGSVRVPRLSLKVELVAKEFCVARVVDPVESAGLYVMGAFTKTKSVSLEAPFDINTIKVDIGEGAVIGR